MTKAEDEDDEHKKKQDYFGGKWWNTKTGMANDLAGSAESGQMSPHGDTNHCEPPRLENSDSSNDSNKKTPVHPNVERPAERVRKMLQERKDSYDEDKAGLSRQLFCQLDVLCTFSSNQQGWKEMARWLKYEEKVEMGNRWSKPHVATTSLHSLFAVREGLASGSAVVALDLKMKHGHLRHGTLAGTLTKMITDQKEMTPEIRKKLYDCLGMPHKHRDRKEKKDTGDTGNDTSEKLKNDFSRLADLRPSISQNRRASIYETNYRSGGLQMDGLLPYKPNKKLLKKIPPGTEAANLMVGHCEFLTERILLFVRLMHPYVLPDLTEVELPTRFIFLAVGPTNMDNEYEYEEIGRAVGVLMSDKVFCEVAYRAKTTQDLVHGMDEFIDGLTVLPPSIWDPQTRLDPPEKTLTQAHIEKRLAAPNSAASDKNIGIGVRTTIDGSLQRTGRLFGGLWADIKRRYPLYRSDITDAFSLQCVASIIFLYFGSIAPTITFGILYGEGTGNYMGTMETLLSGALCGTAWSIFAGQPLIFISATGPMLVYESLLYTFSNDRDIDFLSFRFWTGMWIVLILMVFVAFDLSALIGYITRFAEESFAVLISLIFIYEAFKKTYSIWGKSPININPHRGLDCYCMPPDENSTSLLTTMIPNDTLPEPYTFVNFSSQVERDCVNFEQHLIVNHECVQRDYCTDNGWWAKGTGCDDFTYVEGVCDVFLLCVILFFGTYLIAHTVKKFKLTPYTPTWFRKNVSAFAVMIAILAMTGLDVLLGLGTPKLNVPSKLVTTRSDRSWLVNPMDVSPWYMILIGVVPALLAIILIFLDQQITAVIVNRKENKLLKGHGYHLDLFVVAVLIGLCSVFGLPWCIAATVRSVTHVHSLIRESESSAPGERPDMLGVREQRMTSFVVHLLLVLSIFLTDVLKYVPMPVLYGVFLYMGVASLSGVQFIERIGLLFMPQKYQPDYIYLRHVETWRVHFFTIIQVVCMAAMWAVKSIDIIAIAFPIMILLICFVRKPLDKVFTRTELYWLDHLLPDVIRRQKEDCGDESDDEPEDEKDNTQNHNSVISQITIIEVDHEESSNKPAQSTKF